MNGSRSHTRPGVMMAIIALAVPLALGATACDGDDDGVEPTVVDELDEAPGVPFDNDVDPGVGTDTDERNNQGFDTDEPGEVGNEADPND